MNLSDAEQSVGERVIYVHPATRQAHSLGVIAGVDHVRGLVLVRYGDNQPVEPTHPANLRPRSIT